MMAAQHNQTLGEQGIAKADLSKRLDEVGWGLFFLMAGGLMLIPDERLPHGTWMIGMGVILLGLNVVRYLNHIRVNVFTAALGVLALAVGLGGFFGMQLPFFALFLLLIGASLCFKALFGLKS
jgi:hypothetical protein